jgi:DNA-binding PadR family transcriptional regulator
VLSKTSFVLLGLLKERPMNPYEIIKILGRLNISQWSPISTSAVYMTIHALEKNESIVGKKFKTTAMPEKTVYSVTPYGEKQFMQTLEDGLKNEIRDITRFNLCTLFICHIQKSEVEIILKERLLNIDNNIQATKLAYQNYKDQSVPEVALCSLTHNIFFYETELVSTNVMLKEVSDAKNWDHFLTSTL